ncbi:methyltransferase [Candidatus Woesearchaeota archaeon]|nr:methyltransferase [Candidatus Woesearchaeota archaeon]
MAEHYFTKEPTSLFRPQKVRMAVAGTEIELYTAGGVFSPKQLDKGTRLLIKAAIVKKGWKVLDLGCGYGIVGIAIKKMNPSAEVVMSDVNSRAVKLARMNLEELKMEAAVLHSDAFSNKELDSMRFDTILLNPPQTAGKDVCFRLIEESKMHLVKGGLLQIVARSQKGGKQLSKHMEETFGNVRETAKGSGFRIYISEKG